MGDWLVERLENFESDIRNGNPVDIEEGARLIRRYILETTNEL